MREVKGNLFDYPADAICITTNGDVNTKGLAVMGAGVAKQLTERVPNVRRVVGDMIKRDGNVVNLIMTGLPFDGLQSAIVSFPVKEHWYETARLDLIWGSALALEQMADHFGWKVVALPRPGCGNGGLDWSDVRPVLEEAWGKDDRFVIVDLAG